MTDCNICDCKDVSGEGENVKQILTSCLDSARIYVLKLWIVSSVAALGNPGLKNGSCLL